MESLVPLTAGLKALVDFFAKNGFFFTSSLNMFRRDKKSNDDIHIVYIYILHSIEKIYFGIEIHKAGKEWNIYNTKIWLYYGWKYRGKEGNILQYKDLVRTLSGEKGWGSSKKRPKGEHSKIIHTYFHIHNNSREKKIS